MTTRFNEFINLNDYSEYLPAHKKRGYRVCPVCTGKLSIDTGDGKVFTCYSSQCDRSEIRKAVLALANEKPTWENDPEQVAKREEREREGREIELARIAGLKPEIERDREWRGIIANSFLSEVHKQDMLDRGWTEEQIEISNARSSARGRMIPVQTATGLYVGAQVITKEGKRWYGYGGSNHLKETGELPLAVVYPENPRVGIVYLTESTLDKPWLCAFQQNIVTIGASNIGCNPKDLARTIQAIKDKYGWDEIDIQYVLMADGGAVTNKGVTICYQKLSNQFTELGEKLQFGWWGQVEKSGGDIDEIDTATTIRCLSSDKFFSIGRAQMEKKERVAKSEDHKERQTAADLELWGTLTKLNHVPDDRRCEKFLAALPLPQSGKFMFISSGCGTGKTHQLKPSIDNWLRAYPKARILDIVHRNSIKDGHQRRLGIPEYKTGYGQNEAALNYNQKICVCLDSLLKLSIEDIPKNSLVVLDECEATLNHVTKGGTLGGNTAKVQAHLTAIIDRVLATGGAVVMLEDKLTSLAIDGYLKLTGHRYQHELIVNTYEKFNCNISIGGGSFKSFLALIVDRAKLGEKIFIPTTSQKFGEALQRLLIERLPHLADLIVRTDAKTVPDLHELLLDPNKWLAANRTVILIASPTVESGFSIDLNCFDRRMAYFVNLDTRAHIQLFHRWRSNADTDIFIKEMGAEASSISRCPHKLLKVRSQVANTTALAQGFGKIKNNRIGDVWNELDAQFTARTALSTKHLSDYLEAELVSRGHRVTKVDWQKEHLQITAKLRSQSLESECVSTLAGRFKVIKEEIEVEENEILDRADGEALTVEQATAILHSSGVTFEKKQQAKKCLLHRDFSKTELTEEFLMAAVTKNRGRYRRECELAWLVGYPELASHIDREVFASLLQSPHLLYSKTPKQRQKVDLFANIMPWIDKLIEQGEYQEGDELVLNIQADAIKKAYGFWAVTSLVVQPESIDLLGKRQNTAIATLNKILKKLGYQISSRRVGPRGAQVTVYSVVNADCPHRATMYAAMQLKHQKFLSGDQSSADTSVETVSNHQSISLETVTTNVITSPQVGDRLYIIGEWVTVERLDGEYAVGITDAGDYSCWSVA